MRSRETALGDGYPKAEVVPGTTGELFGRGDDLKLIDELLTGRSRGRCLLLRGDPGTGKSALLEAAVGRARAAGMRVLRGSGALSECELAFAGLHQVLRPLETYRKRLAPAQQRVLSRVFESPDGPPPNRLAVSSAALYHLAEAATDRPLMVALDDAQWTDLLSAEVLTFIGRRIAQAPITLLIASRTGSAGFFHPAELPVWEVRPLAPEPAGALLASRYPKLAAVVRQRLLDEAAGNPLALVELPALLSERQSSGAEALPLLLPMSHRLKVLFADRVGALPEATRQLLLLAALDTGGDLTTVLAAAQEQGKGRWTAEHLSPAEQADLIQVSQHRLDFRPPLLRSSLVQLSAPDEIRAAHHALAAASTADRGRRAWHLAGAAVEPDEEVAQALEDAARAERHDGATMTVSTLVRAAELSPRPDDRARRLAAAAYAAGRTGQLDAATRLLEEARRAHGNPAEAARGARTAASYLLFHREGDLDAAHRLLVRALENAAHSTAASPEGIDEALYLLLLVCCFAARPALWESFDAMLRRHASSVRDLTLVYRDAVLDPAGTAHTVRQRLDTAFAALPDDVEPWHAARLGLASHRVDALGDYRGHLRRLVERARDSGTLTHRLTGLTLLSIDGFTNGQWGEAEALADEGLRLAEAYGYPLLACMLRCQLALVATGRGQTERARKLCAEVTVWAAPRRIEMLLAFARRVRALAALGQGDYETAYGLAVQVARPGAFPPCSRYGPGMVMDLVEAAVHTGRTAQARQHVDAAAQLGIARISPRIALLTTGAAALAAPDDEAGSLYEAALALPGGDRWPFERARIQLAYGAWLRRSRDMPRARTQLRAALDTFYRLGARPWCERARNDLRATGITVSLGDAAQPELTTQELRIAALAAAGLTNRRIGEELHLSHRTVSTHLYKIFPKLGITSRAALRDALARIAPSTVDRMR